MRLRRPKKSGRFLFLGGLGVGGGESSAMILPRLLIPTAWPSSTQFRTLPKSCRNCRTVAVFMYNNHVILSLRRQLWNRARTGSPSGESNWSGVAVRCAEMLNDEPGPRAIRSYRCPVRIPKGYPVLFMPEAMPLTVSASSRRRRSGRLRSLMPRQTDKNRSCRRLSGST